MRPTTEELELAYQRARNFYSQIVLMPADQDRTTYFFEYPTSMQISVGSYTGRIGSSTAAPCSAPVFTHWTDNYRKPMAIGSCCPIKESNKEFAQPWCDFLMDKDLSPFKSILPEEGFEFFKNAKGEQTGFLITSDFIEKYNKSITKCLMIAMRACSEFPAHMRLWKVLMEKGLTPGDALFIVSRFSMDVAGNIRKGNVGNFNHWIVSQQKFDVEGFNEGKMRMDASFSMSVFCLEDKIYWEPPQYDKIAEAIGKMGRLKHSNWSQYYELTLEDLMNGAEEICQLLREK